MLTKEHAIAVIDFAKGNIFPDRLIQSRHKYYIDYAEKMLEIYRSGSGKCRCDLHVEIERVFVNDPEFHSHRIGAFCKLLDDASQYDRSSRGARKLRSRVFALAAESHPLVRQVEGLFQKSEQETKAAIAKKIRRSWDKIATSMFDDVMEFHRLKKFKGYSDPRSLLSRYNVAQVQSALFDALRLRVYATRDYKPILRCAKLAGLMHTITRQDNGTYLFEFDGPASILANTKQYGILMAKFIPGLLSCKGWRMEVDIRHKRYLRGLKLSLSSDDGLSSEALQPEEFDSSVEQAFAEKWGNECRSGWRLEHETEILHSGQHCFFPDFVFVHEDGRRVLLEVIGFWTPEYLQAKRRTLELFEGNRIILAIKAPLVAEFRDLNSRIIEYKTVIKIPSVMEVLNEDFPD